MKPKRLLPAADTLLQASKNIRVLMQLGQQVTRTGFLVVEDLVVDMLLAMAFINNNIKSIYQKQEVVIPTGSGPAALDQPSKGKLETNVVKCPETSVVTEKVPLLCSVGKQK